MAYTCFTVNDVLKSIARYKAPSRLHTLLILFASLSILFLSLCCGEGRKPEPAVPKDRETLAQEAFRAMEDEYNAQFDKLEKSIELGEADPAEMDGLNLQFRRRQEAFVKEYSGTQAAAGVMLGFASLDIDQGEFASAEERFDEVISSMKSGDNLALAYIQKANLVADRDLDAALELAKQAENVKDIDIATKFETRLEQLKLLEQLGLDDRFNALYLQLINEDSGPYAADLAFTRLRYFLRKGDLEAAKGLLDSVRGHVREDSLLVLKSEVVAQNMVGNPAPPIQGVDISGIKISLDKLRGKIVLVAFFTTRNASILRFVPRFNEMYDEYSREGLEMVGICVDTNPDEITAFVARNLILWPVMLDTTGDIQKAYYVIRDPKSFIIDRDGTLVSQGLEGIPLEKEVRRLLGLEG